MGILAVITGAPMSVGVLVLLACIGTWIVFHFLHKRELDRIPLLEERIKANAPAEEPLPHRSPSAAPESVAGSGHLQPMVRYMSPNFQYDKFPECAYADFLVLKPYRDGYCLLGNSQVLPPE